MLDILIEDINPTTVLVGCIVFLIAYVVIQWHQRKNQPPGPIPLPLIGTTYCHGATAEDFIALGKKYGDICTVYLGSQRVLVLNNYDCIRAALVEQPNAFVNRGFAGKYCRTLINPNHHGMLMRNYDRVLNASRKSFVKSLRSLGAGQTKMQDTILDAARTLVDMMSFKKGKAEDHSLNISLAIANVILKVMLNVNYDHEDKRLLDIIEYTDGFVNSGSHVQLIDDMPILRFFEPFKSSLEAYYKGSKNLKDIIWDQTVPKINSSPKKEHECYVDTFIDQHLNNSDGCLNDSEQFKYILRDLMIGGLETTTTSLKWTILFLTNRPHKQKRLHDEIDMTIGKTRDVQISDKQNLPYLRAIIDEVQRLASVVPVFNHQSAHHTSLLGFDVPKDTYAFVNFSSVHLNKETWGDPEEFRPERFLDENSEFVKHPRVIPFALGKRSCAGEILAKQELFLFTATIFQHFRFEPENNGTLISEKPTNGFTRCPMPYKVRAILR